MSNSVAPLRGWHKISITNNRLPWLIDINVFMTPISHATWNTNTVDSVLLYTGYKISSGAQNAEINFDVVLSAGTWTVELMLTTGDAVGIYTVQFDGITIGAIDGYSVGVVYNVRDSITGVSVAIAGKKRLKIIMATKNGSAINYYGAIQHIQLRRTA